jgi:hypothetical protein
MQDRSKPFCARALRAGCEPGVLVALLLAGCATGQGESDEARLAQLRQNLKYVHLVVGPFVPKPGLADAGELVAVSREALLGYLVPLRAFRGIAKDDGPFPPADTLVVQAELQDFRIVGGAARFFGGALAGSSYMIYAVRITEKSTGRLVASRVINSENNPMAAAWTSGANDRSLPSDMGQVIGDFVLEVAQLPRSLAGRVVEGGR